MYSIDLVDITNYMHSYYEYKLFFVLAFCSLKLLVRTCWSNTGYNERKIWNAKISCTQYIDNAETTSMKIFRGKIHYKYTRSVRFEFRSIRLQIEKVPMPKFAKYSYTFCVIFMRRNNKIWRPIFSKTWRSDASKEFIIHSNFFSFSSRFSSFWNVGCAADLLNPRISKIPRAVEGFIVELFRVNV